MGAMDFTSTVEDGGRGWLRIPVPFDPDEIWGAKRIHHVGGTIEGVRVRGQVERVDGRPAFLLSPSWHRELDTAIGQPVSVVLDAEGPQRADLAPDFAAALEAEPEAAEFFDALAQFYRRGYLTWIDATKRSPQKRAERIAETVRLLKAGRKQRD